MFDIGLPELLVVALAAFVVLGPERMPAAARQLGALVVRIKKALRHFNAEFTRALEEDNGDE